MCTNEPVISAYILLQIFQHCESMTRRKNSGKSCSCFACPSKIKNARFFSETDASFAQQLSDNRKEDDYRQRAAGDIGDRAGVKYVPDIPVLWNHRNAQQIQSFLNRETGIAIRVMPIDVSPSTTAY